MLVLVYCVVFTTILVTSSVVATFLLSPVSVRVELVGNTCSVAGACERQKLY